MIVKKRLENVNLVLVYNSAVNLIEQVHQNERVEHNCVQNHSISGLIGFSP